MSYPLRILVVRRDNIGDLICTTPLLHALRRRYPESYIAVLASSYNVDVLTGNTDINEIFVFPKRQQRTISLFSFLCLRVKLILRLRRQNFDYIVLANGGLRYARYLKGKKTIGFCEFSDKNTLSNRQADIIVPLANKGKDLHEVVKLAKLSEALHADGALGLTQVFPQASFITKAAHNLSTLGWRKELPTVAVHISSRLVNQRWPSTSFCELIRQLTKNFTVQIVLFWSPGQEKNLLHPGDDEKKSQILTELKGLPVFPCTTNSIADLIAGLSLCEQMVCSDGGAMHVAAALKKPIVCFFNHPSQQWFPWRVPYSLLYPLSRNVSDITPEDAFSGFMRLQSTLQAKGLPYFKAKPTEGAIA